MAIEQGKLKRLGDTNITTENLSNGKSLVYNAETEKWEPQEVLGGGTGPLGTPTDGDWTDGAIEFNAEDKVVDAIDDLNEVLGELVPANASSISSVSLTTSNSKTTAKIVNGLTDGWENVTGTRRTDISNISAHNVVLSNSDNAFNNADKGILKLYINDVLEAKIDLAANFNEANRKGNQVISEYNTQGDGDAIAGGIVTFVGGKFKITSVGKYNNFSKWQKGNATVEITSAKVGKNEYQIGHEISGAETKSQKTVFYFDNNTVNPSFSVQPTITEKACTGKYLSGIKYYTTGDTFDVAYTVDDAFKTTYHDTKVSEYSMSGINTVTKNPAAVPTTGDQFVVSEVATINANNVMTNTAALNVKVNNAYATKLNETLAADRLVLTVGNVSTKIAESFKDEQYRLPLTFDFESKVATLTGNWDSQTALTDGNAQVYFSGSTPALVYPKTLPTGILPVQTADYSSFSGNQVYVRSFEGANKGNANFTLSGLSSLSDIKIEIKLPGMSGWGNALSPYDSAADKSQDGWGMLQGSATLTGFTATFGGLNTADTNGRIYVRITLLNQNAKLTGISVGW